MIRHATVDDVPQLLVMGARFCAYHPGKPAFSQDRTETTFRELIRTGVILVGERDGLLTGFLAGILMPVWYAELDTALELAYWVEPGQGRLAMQLVKAFEQWAISHDVHHVTMSDLCIDGHYPAGRLIERLGYTAAERCHTKEV